MKKAIAVLLLVAVAGGGAYAYYIKHNQTEVNGMTVGSQVSANITWLGADFNSLVKKGQVIAKLDPTLFEAQVAQSTASLANAKAQLGKDQVTLAYNKLTYSRDQDLRTRGIITQDQLDAAKTAADQIA